MDIYKEAMNEDERITSDALDAIEEYMLENKDGNAFFVSLIPIPTIYNEEKEEHGNDK